MMELNPVRLLVVDDHRLFRKAVIAPLKADARIELVGTVPNGETALKFCSAYAPTIVLLDLHMPNGDGFHFLEHRPREIKAVVMTGDTELESAIRALQLGADGYMHKDDLTEEGLVSAIVAVADGGSYLAPALVEQLIGRISAEKPLPRPFPIQLDESETQLLRAITLGCDNKQLAARLNVTTKTVSNRLSLLYSQLGVRNRVQAATFALRHGMVELAETAI